MQPGPLLSDSGDMEVWLDTSRSECQLTDSSGSETFHRRRPAFDGDISGGFVWQRIAAIRRRLGWGYDFLFLEHGGPRRRTENFVPIGNGDWRNRLH